MKDTKQNNISEVYKFAPLQEAVVEIRFPANLKIESQRHVFFEKFKTDFPRIFMPNPPVAIPQYRFQSEDGRRSIISSINMMAYTTQSYNHFAEFKKDLMEIARFFSETYQISKLKRFGIRYVNIFPVIMKNGFLPLKDLLNLKVELPVEKGTEFFVLTFVTQMKIDDWTMVSRVETGKDNAQDSIKVDFDCFIDGDLNMKFFSEYSDKGHAKIKYFFESMVTDRYRKIMRGEVLG